MACWASRKALPPKPPTPKPPALWQGWCQTIVVEWKYCCLSVGVRHINPATNTDQNSKRMNPIVKLHCTRAHHSRSQVPSNRCVCDQTASLPDPCSKVGNNFSVFLRSHTRHLAFCFFAHSLSISFLLISLSRSVYCAATNRQSNGWAAQTKA